MLFWVTDAIQSSFVSITQRHNDCIAWHFNAPITCGDWVYFPTVGYLRGNGRTEIYTDIYLIISPVCSVRSAVRARRDTDSSFDPVCAGDMAGILAWFWNERFWLPHNVTWADLKNTDEATFPQAEDLYLACPLAFCIFMIRLVFERWV